MTRKLIIKWILIAIALIICFVSFVTVFGTKSFSLQRNISLEDPLVLAEVSSFPISLNAPSQLANLSKDEAQKRIDALKNIIQQQGSLQSYDVLSYQEYVDVKNLFNQTTKNKTALTDAEQLFLQAFTPATFSCFDHAVHLLLERLHKFKLTHALLNECILETISQSQWLKEQEKLNLHLIVDAKKFMRKVFSEEAEGSWIDVFSFINSQDPAFYGLAQIEKIASYQSSDLDCLINEEIWKEHCESQSQKPLKVIIEGAGPNGLYSAIQLFLAGANVTIVNDRGERYIRNQIIDLDPKWAMQLRYFLGTKFDELFLGKHALGTYVEKGHYLAVNTKNLEDALKERLVEISAYASFKDLDYCQFNLLYETVFKEIELPKQSHADFIAHLGTSERPTIDSIRFNQLLIDSKTCKILARDYSNHLSQDEIEVNGIKKTMLDLAKEKAIEEAIQEKTLKIKSCLQKKIPELESKIDSPLIKIVSKKGPKKISIRKQAQLELAGKVPELRNHLHLPVDFLVCCGGVNDPIRNDYLGMPQEKTIPKSYGVSVLIKGDKYQNTRFLKEDHEGRIVETKQTIQPYLEAQKLDELIATSDFLSLSFQNKYFYLTDLILQEWLGNKPTTFNTSENQEIQLRVFENRLTFYIGAETPLILDQFLKELRQEKAIIQIKKEKSPKEQQIVLDSEIKKYDELKTLIEKKWFAALAYCLISQKYPKGQYEINFEKIEDPKKLNFDPSPINTAIFPVVQYALEKAAYKMDFDHSSLLIIAVGDSLASPHFFTGSGLSTGRVGIENMAKLVKAYHKGRLGDKEQLTLDLNHKLDHVKLAVLDKGGHYVQKNPDQIQQNSAYKKMCHLINAHYQDQLTGNFKSRVAYKIIRDKGELSQSQPDFTLEIESKTFEIQVTKEGKLAHENERYETILQAVIALKNKMIAI